MTYLSTRQPPRPAPRSLAPPPWLWLATALLLPLAVVGPNALLGAFAIGVLAAGLGLLWRPGEPPILLFIFLYQWTQAATGALYGNALGLPLTELVPFDGRHEFASVLMLAGTLVLAIAMRVAAGPPSLALHHRVMEIIGSRDFSFWTRLYAAAWVFSTVFQFLAPLAGGLAVPFLTLSGVKWAAFVLLTICAFTPSTDGKKAIWLTIFVFEFLMSIGGFFSEFKDVFFYSLFGLAAANVKLRLNILAPGGVVVAVMLFLALVWTAIKVDYRGFVNSGTGQQVVMVNWDDQMSELGRLLGQVDTQKLQDASHQLFGRLMYHHFFGAALVNVPASIPHANGEIWSEAISRPFLPRVFFPNKRAIDDSDLTNLYTGLGVASAEAGTSISLGYIAEAYIDFSVPTMFFAIAVLGAGLGFFYKWLVNRKGSMAVIGVALAPFALMPAHTAETSILKMIPALILSLLACVIVMKVLAPALIGRLRSPLTPPL